MTTIHDVARRAGVSIATASRALNGIGPMRPETHRKILEAAKSLDYQPNLMAKGLRLGRSSTVGLLVGDIEVTVYGTLIRQMQEQLGKIGLDLLIFTMSHSEDRMREVLDRVPSMNL